MKRVIPAAAAAAGFLLLGSTQALSFGEPEHSSITSSVKEQKKDDALEFAFKVKPEAKNMKVTFEAPWQLTLKNHKGLEFEKTEWDQSDLDKELPGYSIKATLVSQPKGTLKYELTAFVCTTDDKGEPVRCFREVHEKTLEWKKTKKS